MIAPFFEEKSGEFTNIIFVKVDVDDLDVSHRPSKQSDISLNSVIPCLSYPLLPSRFLLI